MAKASKKKPISVKFSKLGKHRADGLAYIENRKILIDKMIIKIHNEMKCNNILITLGEEGMVFSQNYNSIGNFKLTFQPQAKSLGFSIYWISN